MSLHQALHAVVRFFSIGLGFLFLYQVPSIWQLVDSFSITSGLIQAVYALALLLCFLLCALKTDAVVGYLSGITEHEEPAESSEALQRLHQRLVLVAALLASLDFCYGVGSTVAAALNPEYYFDISFYYTTLNGLANVALWALLLGFVLMALLMNRVVCRLVFYRPNS